LSKFKDQGPPQFSIAHCDEMIAVHKNANIPGQVEFWKKVRYAVEWYWHHGYSTAINDAKEAVTK